MRLIHPLTAAAALAAAALVWSAPASAQGGGMGDSVRGGPRGGGGGAGNPGVRVMRDVVRSPRRGRDHPDRDRRRDRLYGWPDAPLDADWTLPGSEGFFGDGEAIAVGGGVVYDYDRSYPYRYYNPPRFAAAPSTAGSGSYRCQVERVPSGRGRADAAVRVCRR